MDRGAILENVREVSSAFAGPDEQAEAEATGAGRLRPVEEAGFHLVGVPIEQGGIWESVGRSTRPICEMLRTLAHADSSMALVCSMHPSVLAYWLATPSAPPPFESAWEEQRQTVFKSVLDGHWWGTITSEPGSGGDITRTKAVAAPDATGNGYRLTGQKHFGSGSGISSFMVTTAVPEGEAEPDWFYLYMRGAPWDGSTGVKLMAEWDGHGMIATQSHSMLFENFPATRIARPGNLLGTVESTGGAIGCFFTSVIVGIVETAIEVARERLARMQESLRSYEQMEWARVELDGWVIQQAYQGMLRAIEENGSAPYDVLQGKTAVAELAEATLSRICKIMGGGTFNRYAPFGFWFEDVRALGFLRPPWGLAYETLYKLSWANSGG